jgi:hypothetical protein
LHEGGALKKSIFIYLCLLLVINSTNINGSAAVTAKSELTLFENRIPLQQNMPPSPPALLEPAYGNSVSPTPNFVMLAIDDDNDRLRFRLDVLQGDIVILTFNQVQDMMGWDKADYASGEIATFTLPDSHALPDGAYKWRAFTFDGHQWSESSQSEPFNVEAVPGKVELVANVPGMMKDVFVQGDYAYVISDRGLLILDVSNPAQPIECSSVPILVPTHVYVSGSYAYVTGVGLGLKVLDISDPYRPIGKGVIDSPYGGGGLYVSGSYAYMTAADFGLRVIDISNPEAPIELGYYCPQWHPPTLLDLPEFPEPPDIPEQPEPPELFEPIAMVDIHVSGSYAYVVGWPKYLGIINISNPVSPSLVSTYSLPTWEPICVHGSDSYAYVGTLYHGVRVINVSNPMAPAEAGFCDPQYDHEPWHILNCSDIYVSQPYAYLAHALGMIVLDISVPATPQVAGWYDTWSKTIGAAEPHAVYTSGSYVYLATDWAGLFILRFKEPQPPQNMPPDPPALFSPNDRVDVSATPTFTIITMDPENDRLQYKIEILQNNVIVRTFDQTQDTTGWDRNQYFSDQLATFTIPENKALSPGTYQWRAYAYDGMQWSSVSLTRFMTVPHQPPPCSNIYDNTIIDTEVENRPGYSIYVPSSTTSGWWRNMYLFPNINVMGIGGLDSYDIRVQRYRNAFVAAMMQPELTYRLKTTGEIYLLLNDMATFMAEVTGTESELANLASILKSKQGIFDLNPVSIQTTLLDFQQVLEHKHLVQALDQLSEGLAAISFVAHISADVLEDIFLHAITNAMVLERMECLDKFFIDYAMYDPAVTGGYTLARQDVNDFVEQDVSVIQSTLNSFQDHSADYIIRASEFLPAIAQYYGYISEACAASVKRVVLFWYLAYDIGTDLSADIEDMQSMCAAATLNAMLYDWVLALEAGLPESSEPSYSEEKRLLLTAAQIRYGLGYWYHAKYDQILNLNMLNPYDWITLVVQLIMRSHSSVVTFQEEFLKPWMDNNYNYTVETIPCLSCKDQDNNE